MKSKRIISAIMALAMIVSMMGVGVYAEGPVEVTTFEELLAALEKDNAYIIMMNDITGTATNGGYSLAGIKVQAGDVLDGNGKKLTINGADSTWDCAIAMTGGTVKNLTIAGAMRGIFMPGANGDVVIDNCVFEDVIYTFNSDAGSKDYTVTIKNTTLNGWTSFSNVHKSVAFENCTFGEGSGYAFCRPYQPTTFNGCEFNEGYEFDNKRVDDNEHAFNNCTYNSIPLSADNNAMFYAGGSVLIDGVATDVTQYAAKIGEIKYGSLSAAINKVQNGETIVLLNDVTEDVTINKSITLDGADKQYTGKIEVSGNVKVTVKNVNFVDGDGYAVTTRGVNTVSVEDCTVNGYSYGFLYAPKSTANVIIKNVTISNCAYGLHWYYGTNATLENVKMTDVKYGVRVQNHADKTVTFKKCEISGEYPVAVWEKGTANQTFVFEGTNNLGATEFTISDYAKLKLADADSVLTACAGLSVTSDDPEHNVVYEEGAYKVARVARIGENEYITFQDAIDAAADGDTIKVVRDTDANNTTLSKDVTIDLNGRRITGNVVVDEGATVEIKNGTIICKDGGYDTINSFGNVTLTDVEADGERHIVRAKKGTVTINGGTYKWTGSATGTRNVINIGDDGDPTNNVATATINGGTFIGPKGTSADSGAAVLVQKGSTVTIKDGMFTNGKNSTLAAQDGATLTVEGGTYDQDPTAYVAERSRAVKNVVTGIWSVIPAGHTIDIEAVPAECYGEEGVAVSVTVNGVDFANAEWTLTYDPSVVEYVDHTDGTNGIDISAPSEASGVITDKLYTHTDGDPFKGSTVVVTYNFKTISQDTDDVEGIFTLANAVVDTAKSSNYGDTEVEGDTTKVIVKRRDFENITISEAVNGTTEDITDKITDSKYEIKYDGFVHEFAVDTSADGEIINYTITKDGADVTEIRAKGTYVITYTIEKIGYKPYTDTLTVVIGDPAFVLETSTYTLENYTLVMVYMNAEGMYPTFDGKAMYDITASGYEYQADPTAEGVPYGYVYGIVIPEPGATDDLKAKVAFNTSAPLAVKLYDEDVNFNGEVTDRDAVVAVNTYKGNKDQLEDYDLLSRVLKADVTKNKKVDMDDVTAVELKAAK